MRRIHLRPMHAGQSVPPAERHLRIRELSRKALRWTGELLRASKRGHCRRAFLRVPGRSVTQEHSPPTGLLSRSPAPRRRTPGKAKRKSSPGNMAHPGDRAYRTNPISASGRLLPNPPVQTPVREENFPPGDSAKPDLSAAPGLEFSRAHEFLRMPE